MRDLLIVARNEPELYEYLKQRFVGRPDVEVILDRRVGERRREQVATSSERRRGGDRRERPQVDEDIKTLGFAVVPLPADRAPTSPPRFIR